MQGYNEMLRRINPEKIICYGKPFDEMKGDIVEVDYAKTNNLDKSCGVNGKYIKRQLVMFHLTARKVREAQVEIEMFCQKMILKSGTSLERKTVIYLILLQTGNF